MGSEKHEINEELVAFKNELKNYNFYKKRVKAQQELIDLNYDMLSGVKAIRYDKEPTHTPPNKDVEYKLRAEIDAHTLLRDTTQAKIDEIDKVLNLIESSCREAIIEAICNKKGLEKVAKSRNISKEGLFYQINKGIKEALEHI